MAGNQSSRFKKKYGHPYQPHDDDDNDDNDNNSDGFKKKFLDK